MELNRNVLTHKLGVWSLEAWGTLNAAGRWRGEFDVWFDDGIEHQLAGHDCVTIPGDFADEDVARRRAMMAAIAEVIHKTAPPRSASTTAPMRI